MNELFPEFGAAASIEMSHVCLTRGENVLFNDLSLNIAPGDVVYVQGRNGIGKTSLLRLAAGFARADSGNIIWSRDQRPCPASNLISYQGHNDAFKPTLKTLEDLSFWSDLNGFSGSLMDVLAYVALEDKAKLRTGELSAGQRRRLAMGRLIVCRKPIWIMDEPAAAMDAVGSALIDDIVARHINRGGSVMLASHMRAKSLSKNTRRLVMDAAA